jgi:hypothetical protein
MKRLTKNGDVTGYDRQLGLILEDNDDLFSLRLNFLYLSGKTSTELL